MKTNFRTFVLASAVIAAAAMATIPAMAATSATLNVPFSFTVDGRTLPAGQYSVARSDNNAFVSLRSANSDASYTWVGSPAGDGSNRVILKFDAASHALETVQFGSTISPRLNKHSKSHETVVESEFSGQ
jgi:hypothetical protein